MSKLRRPDIEPQEMDLKCFMNLMVVLIPMLLISAEFAKVAIIDIKLPLERGSNIKDTQTTPSDENKDEKLLLTAIITDSVVTLGAKGGFMPSLFYKEYHRYLTKDNYDTLIEYTPGRQPINPRTGKEFTVHERFEIYLYTTDENRNILKSLYTEFGEMLTNADGNPVEKVSPGDTVFALTNPRRRIIVTDPSKFESKPLSAYDELKNRLMKVKERYREAVDADDIIIAAENEVIFDKIVQIMDAARTAEFPNISIAKLRG
jgi:biopolymer transport protein ExbD